MPVMEPAMSPQAPTIPQPAMTCSGLGMTVEADAAHSEPEDAWGYECALPYLVPEWGASASLG